MYKIILITVLLFIYNIFLYSADRNIYSIVDKEITVSLGFAGESFALIKENNNFILVRKILGSGVPVVGEIKYKVFFDNEYKIIFSEIIYISDNIRTCYSENKELFELIVNEQYLFLYLNGKTVDIIRFDQ